MERESLVRARKFFEGGLRCNVDASTGRTTAAWGEGATYDPN